MLQRGDTVVSIDPRDERGRRHRVVEAGIAHVGGPVAKVYHPESGEVIWRMESVLVRVEEGSA
jgi:hypothetical protein